MNLYLCSQDQNQGYDTYDSFIGAFDSEEEARNQHPLGNDDWDDVRSPWWNSPNDVKVVFIGEASTNLVKGIVLASFNSEKLI